MDDRDNTNDLDPVARPKPPTDLVALLEVLGVRWVVWMVTGFVLLSLAVLVGVDDELLALAREWPRPVRGPSTQSGSFRAVQGFACKWREVRLVRMVEWEVVDVAHRRRCGLG